MEQQYKFNPFNEYGIASYSQFSKYPFLVFRTLDTIIKGIDSQIRDINNGYFAGDRRILIGERGIGKTSTLFFIKEKLENAGIKVIIFSRLIESGKHYEDITGSLFSRDIQKPIYVLIDFPDTLETKSYKRFLEFLWSMITHPNQDKINLVFAMNKSHFDKSFSYSEIFGKFITIRLERLDREYTERLIDSRLSKIDKDIREIFDDEVLELIYCYSKGIPRNIISACCLLFTHTNGEPLRKSFAETILMDEFIEQVIKDRVEDIHLQKTFRLMIDILKNKFGGVANSQEDYIKEVMAVTEIGRNSIINRILNLEKMGIFSINKGGYNRLNKIISFN